MTMAEKNTIIEEKFKEKLSPLGLSDKLKMDPIPNGFKRRNHFTQSPDGKLAFTVYM